MKFSVNTPPGIVEHDIDVSSITFEIADLGSVDLKHFKISYEVLHGEENIEIGGDRIAKFLVQGIGSDIKVIWDEDLRLFRVDDTTKEVGRCWIGV
jgi:hypothetical protein